MKSLWGQEVLELDFVPDGVEALVFHAELGRPLRFVSRLKAALRRLLKSATLATIFRAISVWRMAQTSRWTTG
jgi:hypothetical protein